MERINWSSLTRRIGHNRSGKALFFKPVCVLAAIDLVDEGRLAPNDLDAAAVLDRFSDYVSPFFKKRGSKGYEPLWRLSNDHLWTFYKGDRALTPSDFTQGSPSTRSRLLGSSDRMAIDQRYARLWASPSERGALRGEMLLMLHDGDGDSRVLAAALFDPRHLSSRDRWPSQEALEAHLAPLRQPTLFDDDKSAHSPPDVDRLEGLFRASSTIAGDRRWSALLEAVVDVPSAVDYAWSGERIVVAQNSASLPRLPFASSAREHAERLEACRVQAEDLLGDIRRRRWNVREDYGLEVERYLQRLPREAGTGSVLLADAAIRILRDMFEVEAVNLPPPFAAMLRTLLQQHLALRPYYPEIESFFRAVRTGRLEQPLPLDAIEGVKSAVREQTPSLFDGSVSAAIGEASAPEPDVDAAIDPSVPESAVIRPPPDPLGEVDQTKAHDFQIAGALNALWKVFTSADKLQASTEAWMRAYNGLSGPIGSVLEWLRYFSQT